MRQPLRLRPLLAGGALLGATALVAACAGSNEPGGQASSTSIRSAATSVQPSTTSGDGTPRRFTAQVWADNWFALYANGKLVGEDPVPITTERSFNAETVSFDATYPLTIAMVTKDFKENDTGLEYIGTPRQQMGDGGVIAQVTETATGKVVAVTGPKWRELVVHRAPLDTACETSASPATECTSEVTGEPTGWTSTSFDDSKWTPATVYTEDEVQPKEGYVEVTWDPSARLIWSASLTQDNTILWRATVP